MAAQSSGRAWWVVIVFLLAAFALRAGGCGGKGAPARTPTPAIHSSRGWPTPLLTKPPPRPTPTLWKGVTAVPALPE